MQMQINIEEIRENVVKYRLAVVFFGSVFAAVCLLLTAGTWLLHLSGENLAKAGHLRQRQQLIRLFSARHRNYQDDRQALCATVEALRQRIPETCDFNKLTDELNSFAAMHGVNLVSLVRPVSAKGVRTGQVMCYRLQIIATGPCQQLLDFMKTAEQNGGMIFFDDVVLEVLEGENVRLNATLNVYAHR